MHLQVQCCVYCVGMGRFNFFEKQSFRFVNDCRKIEKRNDRFLNLKDEQVVCFSSSFC